MAQNPPPKVAAGRARSIKRAGRLTRFAPGLAVLLQYDRRWLPRDLLAGLSVKAAAVKLRLPFALESVYRLGRKLRQQLAHWRTRLCREQPPPASGWSDPLLQTVEHFQRVFAGEVCPPSAFQLRFQQSFVG